MHGHYFLSTKYVVWKFVILIIKDHCSIYLYY